MTVSDCKRHGAVQPSTRAGWSVPLLFTTMSVLKHFVDVHYYTQKKKFSQYLCFLIKSKILHISLSFFYISCIIVTLHVPVYCVTNNASITLYQPNFKMHDVHVLG